jgi:hypothetical protein
MPFEVVVLMVVCGSGKDYKSLFNFDRLQSSLGTTMGKS